MPLSGVLLKVKFCLGHCFLLWVRHTLAFVLKGALGSCASPIDVVELKTGFFKCLFGFPLKGLILFPSYAHSQSLILEFCIYVSPWQILWVILSPHTKILIIVECGLVARLFTKALDNGGMFH